MIDPIILHAPHIAGKLDAATRKARGVLTPTEAQQRWQAREERKIHDTVSTWLKQKQIPFIHARMDKPSTIKKGWPDFTCMKGHGLPIPPGEGWPSCRVCCVEVKAPGGILSDAQAECIAELRLAHVPAKVCYSSAEAIDFIIAELLT